MFLAQAKQALIIISERIGDAIFCTPAIRFLKQQYPNLKITILALSVGSGEVFWHNPDIEKLVVTPSIKEFLKLSENCDVLIDLHASKKTFGYLEHWRKTAYISPRAGKPHQSRVALEFIHSLTGGDLKDFNSQYRLFPQAESIEAAKKLLTTKEFPFSEKLIYIGCHMGCYKVAQRLRIGLFRRNKLSHKSWPSEYFAQLQKMLYEKYPNVRLVLTGSKSEAKLLKRLHTDLPNLIPLFGKTSILLLAALMPLFKVFLTGDTGPLHVAASTHVPIVALFFSPNMDQTGPYPLCSQHHVLYNGDAFAITPQMVFAELEKYINGNI